MPDHSKPSKRREASTKGRNNTLMAVAFFCGGIVLGLLFIVIYLVVANSKPELQPGQQPEMGVVVNKGDGNGVALPNPADGSNIPPPREGPWNRKDVKFVNAGQATYSISISRDEQIFVATIPKTCSLYDMKDLRRVRDLRRLAANPLRGGLSSEVMITPDKQRVVAALDEPVVVMDIKASGKS